MDKSSQLRTTSQLITNESHPGEFSHHQFSISFSISMPKLPIYRKVTENREETFKLLFKLPA